MTADWAIKTSTNLRTKNSKLLCCVPSYCAYHKRPLVKFYGSNDHPGSDCNVVVVEEEQGCGDGEHDMVFTWRDIIPRQDRDSQQTCVVRGDKNDSRSQVGTFYVKNNQVNNFQESEAQVTVKEKSGSLPGEDDIKEDSDESECHSLQGSNIIGHDPDGQYFSPFMADAEASATSHISSSDNIGQCICEDDTNSKRDRSPRKVDNYSSSAAEKEAAVSDNEADGQCPTSRLQGGDEDSALDFPTPASLSMSEANSLGICCVGKSSVTLGFSEMSFPPPSHSLRYPSHSVQQPSPLHPHTRQNPAHLQHNSNSEEVKSKCYTTSSFRKPAITTETQKEEPQRSRTHLVSDQGFPSPRYDLAASATAPTQHQHLPETVNICDGLVSVGRDVTITTCAVPETSAGKMKDSLCLTVEAAVLPAPMKAGLIVPSHTR